jgi:hypothetical protein
LKTSSNNLDDLAADLIAISRRASFRKTADANNNGEAAGNVVRNLKGVVA